MRLAVLLGLATAAGCFSPELPAAPFRCGTGDACPSGYSCRTSDNLCLKLVRDGSFAAEDGAIDARVFDGRPRADARIDARPGVDAAPLPDGFSCTAGAFVSCKNEDIAFVCNNTGDGVSELACEAGCDETGHRCLHCVPSTTQCSLDELVTCDANGEIASRTTCVAGCDDSVAPAACLVITPQLLRADTCRSPGGVQPPFPAGRTEIDTTACADGEKVSQGSSLPDLCVFRYATVQLAAGRTLAFTGNRIPVIVATTSMVIDGTIDVAGRGGLGGPGARPDAKDQGGNSPGDESQGGGGGGGSTDGAPGADDAPTGAGGIAGKRHMSTKHLYPGGFGGDGGPCIFCENGVAGGGGGALNLVSCGTMRIGATAILNAGGGGGPGGELVATVLIGGGGAGGGAGGEVLLEAAEITVLGGVMVANGGGGGGAAVDLVGTGKPGEDGSFLAAPAAGGDPAVGGGRGGDGGTGEGGPAGGLLPLAGGNPTSDRGGGGGGGGAAGRLRALARPDRPIDIPGSTIISPKLHKGDVERSR